MLERSMSVGERAELAREHVVPEWDSSRASHLLDQTRARLRRRRIQRAGTGVALAAAAAVLFVVFAGPAEAPGVASAPTKAPVVEQTDSIFRFADGSRAIPGAGGELVVVHVHDQETRLDLRRGSARFQVTPGMARDFVVEAGAVEVSVVGTVFEVIHREPLVEVVVTEGRVRVAWDGGEAFVSAGEEGVFPREREPEPEPPADEPEEAEPTPASTMASSGERPPHQSWEDLASEDRFDEGWALLEADRSVLRSDDVEDLLTAADLARHSGHLAAAAPYLERALVVSRGDPREQLVTFTLGRVRLDLGDARGAAAIFARARSIDPTGSLASDALAREVQAWSRAGDSERAKELALEYLRLHPQGTHASMVRRYGGVR